MFKITQHTRDEELLKSLVNYLNCGQYYTPLGYDRGDFIVKGLISIDKIILFFNKYPIEGVKVNEIADFCKAAKLIKDKAHLTAEGLDQVRKIKSGMKRGRSQD